MDDTLSHGILREFGRSKTGIAGVGILGVLIGISLSAVIFVPVETFQDWNNPNSWISLPKTSVPAWVNWLYAEKIPEHLILEPVESSDMTAGISVSSHKFGVVFDYDDFPNDFIYEFEAEYSASPLLQLSVIRPDGLQLDLLSFALPHTPDTGSHGERIFSTDSTVRKNLLLQSDQFAFETDDLPSEDIVFSRVESHGVLKGDYVFLANLYGVKDDAQITDSRLIVGGKAFGAMGTDELRRDLAVGLVWGTPLALFIGIAVAAGSVAAGLIYGVYAGYRGRFTDEAMMRLNDIVYALPALPFLIILAVTLGSSVFLTIGFLMMFGWVGVAKVSRSMALQIKTTGYVVASKTMGRRDSGVMLRHMLPQLLPYALASVAISVPAAITTEAGLSFLGLGDPAFPTWGQILHDANSHGATARGLWWWIVPPGIMIAVTGLAFVFIGNALDAVANPRLKR